MFRSWIIDIVTRALLAGHNERATSALERQYDIAAKLEAEKAINIELRVMLAQARANFDWLAARMHEIHQERAALYRRIGMDVPVPTIARLGEALPAPDGYEPPSKRAPLGDLINLARDIAEKPRNQAVDEGSSELSFEDVGDGAAAALGITHGPDGELLFVK